MRAGWELVHGIYRAQTPEMRLRRESFIEEMLRDVTVYRYTKEAAMLAGKIASDMAKKHRIARHASSLDRVC
jgi:predicted nucleic acid-binding protein